MKLTSQCLRMCMKGSCREDTVVYKLALSGSYSTLCIHDYGLVSAAPIQ